MKRTQENRDYIRVKDGDQSNYTALARGRLASQDREDGKQDVSQSKDDHELCQVTLAPQEDKGGPSHEYTKERERVWVGIDSFLGIMTSLAWPVCYETMSFIIQSPNPSLVSMQSLSPFPHVAVMNFLAPPKKQEEERGKYTATMFKSLSPLPPPPRSARKG